MPKVSVLTPLYNTNPIFLREMIKSMLNQTFSDFEFIIVNDSPDNNELADIVMEFNDPRICFEVNEKNLGISESRNRLFDMSRGEYLAIFDHDDVSAPTRLEKQVAYLDAHPEVGVVGTYAGILGKGRPLRHPIENMDIKQAMLFNCVISHSSSMLRKSVMLKHNIRWREEYSPAEDYMLWAELMPYTMFHNIPEELIQWRIYQESSGAIARVKMADAAMQIRSMLQQKYPSLLKRTRWIRLLGIVPLIKIYERGAGDTRYLLFGVVPLACVR